MNRSVLFLALTVLALNPSMALAQCGTTDCAVGAAGNGGVNSDGKAQGFHFEGPTPIGEHQVNSGNSFAGHLTAPGGSFCRCPKRWADVPDQC